MRQMLGLMVVLAVLFALPTQVFGELFTNESFEDAPGGSPVPWGQWGAYASYWGDGYTEFKENDPLYPAFDGQNCARAVGSDYATWFQTLTFDTDWIPGNTYYWGFWAKDIEVGGSTGPVQTAVRFYDTVGEGGNGDVNLDADHTIPADGNWHYVEYEFTISAGMVEMSIYATSQGPGDYLIDLAHLDSTSFDINFATAPDPYDGKIIGTSLTDLSWTNPADMVSVDVYFLDAGTSPRANDPNLGPAIFDPGVVQLVTDGAVSTVSLPSTPVFGNYYYWAVHVTDSSTETQGMAWSYSVGDAPPVPNAGANQYEGLDPTVATVDLNGAVTDDGISPQTYLWTVDPTTGVTIASDTSQVTTATITAVGPATGPYTFTLTATDGTGPVADTMTATVYDTPCEAVYADPAGIATQYPDGHGDIDGDCDTDIEDFALFAATWLDCFDARLGCTP
jgi:hypothetical protein